MKNKIQLWDIINIVAIVIAITALVISCGYTPSTEITQEENVNTYELYDMEYISDMETIEWLFPVEEAELYDDVKVQRDALVEAYGYLLTYGISPADIEIIPLHYGILSNPTFENYYKEELIAAKEQFTTVK